MNETKNDMKSRWVKLTERAAADKDLVAVLNSLDESLKNVCLENAASGAKRSRLKVPYATAVPVSAV